MATAVSSNKEAVKTWSAEDLVLINWFSQLRPEELPKPPFLLAAHATVTGDLFYARIREDIKTGVNGIQARSRELQENLRRLKKIIDEKTTKEKMQCPLR